MDRLTQLLPLLACTACHGELRVAADSLHCCNCEARFPVVAGVPIMLPGSNGGDFVQAAEVDHDKISQHPYSPGSEKIIADHAGGWVLDLGAGGKLERRDNVVQLDIFRYPCVDIVGSADCLPFRDAAFDAVVSQAVFEHLKYPEWAVAEIGRVLKPNGVVKVDTAFLQPEHGYPHHYYNATMAGLSHWFRDFDIEWRGIEPYQRPVHTLSWFLGQFLDAVDRQTARQIKALSVGELLDLLSEPESQAGNQALWEGLQALPPDQERALASGVSLIARNPEQNRATGANMRDKVLAQEAAIEELKAQIEILGTRLQLRLERCLVAEDTARYLERFYPSNPLPQRSLMSRIINRLVRLLGTSDR